MSSPDAVHEIISAWGVARPQLDVSALDVFGHLHRSYLLYRAEINQHFDEFGISEAGFDVLASLRRAPSFRRTAGELARQTLVTTGGLTLRVDRLTQAGLVNRARDENDSRIVYVTLTQTGKRLVDDVADIHFAALSQLLSELSAREQKQLAHLLMKLEASIRDAVDRDANHGGAGSEAAV